MRIGHTACHRGKRVSVKLKNDQIIIGRFEGRNDREVFVDGHKIHKENIRSFVILRGLPHGS